MKYLIHRLFSECSSFAGRVLESAWGVRESPAPRLAPEKYGDLMVTLVPYVKKAGKSYNPKVAEEALSKVELPKFFSEARIVGPHLNVRFRYGIVFHELYKEIERFGERYGSVFDEGKLYLVEHTSANPIHQLHIGHARNAILGDSLARLVMFCGAKVRRHFYVDDCGLQVSYIALAVKLLGGKLEVPKGVKPDEYLGRLYPVISCLIEKDRIRKEIEKARKLGDEEKVRELEEELKDWEDVEKELRERFPEEFKLLEERAKGRELFKEAMEINRAYEAREEWAVKLVREVTYKAIEGFKQTLSKLGIDFDSWDWESEIAVWSGRAKKVVEEVLKTGYAVVEDGAVIFDAERYVAENNLWSEFGLKPGTEIPRATLTRSDGTTLYLTRDVAYAIWKFETFNPHLALNVISIEQRHEQLHLRIILHAIGKSDWARRLVHYEYEMVHVPGMRMSSRRGRYITLDWLIKVFEDKVKEIVAERTRAVNEEAVIRSIAKAAIRYMFLSVSPTKVMTVDVKKALNMSQNSGPFLQYTYARMYNILVKAGEEPGEPPENVEVSDEERAVVRKLLEWPLVVENAYRNLRVDPVANYANELALAFNRFYEKCPVIKAESEEKRRFRLALVKASMTVLGIALDILGIDKLERI